MFLKVKRAAGKQYFAICESVRRDNKIFTKTIRSLGNEDKARLILESEYPEYLTRFNEVVGTKKCRDKTFYGLYTRDGEFLCVYYSGMHMGLPFRYETYAAAETERKKYTDPDFYQVREMPYEMVINYEAEMKRRREMI